MTEFLSNLEKTLAGNVLIEPPKEEFGKHLSSMMFQDSKGRNITSCLKQFVCTPPNIVHEGPAISSDNMYTLDIDKDFTIEHIQKLTILISDFSKKICFVPLLLPYGVITARLERHNSIVGRYLEVYHQMTDDVLKRWDFLVMKLDF